MKTWWVVANEQQGWRWDWFFKHAARTGRGANRWGGAGWIKSRRSRVNVDGMRAGDMVVAYQAGEGIQGFAWLASDGYSEGGTGRANMFDIAYRRAIRLAHPIPFGVVEALPDAEQNFEFVAFHQGTVYWVTPAGRVQLGLLAAACNPGRIGSRCITATARRRGIGRG